jgi:hypothetical protein
MLLRNGNGARSMFDIGALKSYFEMREVHLGWLNSEFVENEKRAFKLLMS